MVNIFRIACGREWVSGELAFFIGSIQALLVLAFVIGSIPGPINFTQYPDNLMWAAVATRGALVTLSILPKWNNLLSISGNKTK